MNMNEHIDHLYTRRGQAEQGGGHEKLAQQRQKESSPLGKGSRFFLIRTALSSCILSWKVKC